MNRVIVIGSGFGGLAAAIRLQARGYSVTIMEKNEKIGGHAYQFRKNGYTFDMGPSLITAPDIIDRIFKSAGRQMTDYLDLIYLDPFYRIYYHDGTLLDYSGNSEKMKSQMAKFNPQDAKNYDRFIEHTRQLYDAVITDGLGSRPFDFNTLVEFLPQALKLKALQPTYQLVKKYFKDPRHRFAFSFHPLFIGGSPFRSPAVYLMIPYLEKHGGVWFTRGGMYSVVEALRRLFLEIGGEIQTSSEVTEIMVRNKRAVGVIANNHFHQADAVVSNAHFAHTYKDLIQPQHRRKWNDRKVKRLDYSMSTFLMYIGVRKQYPQLLHHTLILSERYQQLVKDIFDRKILANDFSMYLHVPTRTDSEMAPPGCESMYVLIPVPNLAGNINWDEMAQPFANKVLQFLEEDFQLTGLQENIEVLELFTPNDFAQQRNNYLGSAWGVEPKFTQTASFRPHNRSEDIERLYLVGASTHPGAGVPGVLLTAEATEKVMLEDLGIPVVKPQPELMIA
ncbi:phytoene desaturase [Candidatus Saccharibacteria bacterium]|nr:phytoene desaturase [Candidatus Saccharibacteria bacterium]NIW80230.1 phytoene desaturase [Calditrichia bacterium]